ncbi:hypothetical protein Tco_0276740 [Tanacetum coccineum]
MAVEKLQKKVKKAPKDVAIIFGVTGLVGKQLLEKLLARSQGNLRHPTVAKQQIWQATNDLVQSNNGQVVKFNKTEMINLEEYMEAPIGEKLVKMLGTRAKADRLGFTERYQHSESINTMGLIYEGKKN